MHSVRHLEHLSEGSFGTRKRLVSYGDCWKLNCSCVPNFIEISVYSLYPSGTEPDVQYSTSGLQLLYAGLCLLREFLTERPNSF